MTKGWHRESKRHSLASKGIPTKKSGAIGSKMSSAPKVSAIDDYDKMIKMHLAHARKLTSELLKDGSLYRVGKKYRDTEGNTYKNQVAVLEAFGD